MHAGLGTHPLDDPADPRRQLSGVQASRCPGHVAHQAGGELDLVENPQDGEERAQVRRHWLLQREQLVHLLLDAQHQALDLAVGRVDPVGEREVGVEERVGRGPDLLAALGRELHHLGPDLVLSLVERSPGLDHVSSGVSVVGIRFGFRVWCRAPDPCRQSAQAFTPCGRGRHPVHLSFTGVSPVPYG
jgi:hypothetical protein